MQHCHRGKNFFPEYPITLGYSSSAHSWRSAHWKTNNHPLLQSAFPLPPFKINIKNYIWDLWPILLECRRGEHEKNQEANLSSIPKNVSTSQGGKGPNSAATGFLVLAERRIPISRTEFIWIYFVKYYDNECVLKTEYKTNQYESDKSVINITNSSQRQEIYGFC